ncbi:MAG: hypothetical protein ACOC5T_04970 [Elusimicrobiota bacterium]
MLSTKTEYSEAEWKLIDYFGFRSFAESSSSTPFTLYREIALYVFLQDISGPSVDAARRALRAMNNCNPYRMTPEFDELISFEENN